MVKAPSRCRVDNFGVASKAGRVAPLPASRGGPSFLLLFFGFTQDEISGLLRGAGRLQEQLLVVVKGFQPTIKVSARVVKSRGIIKAARRRQERGPQLGDKLFKAVALFTAPPIAFLEAVQAGLVAGAVY